MENKNILSYLEQMKGKVLKIFKGGPESKTGKLLSANKDIITIQTDENQVVYYQLKHVKSIIENSKSAMMWDDEEEEKVEEVKANNFIELLQHLKNKFVHINGGGPAYRTGILLDFNPDYLVLQTKDDLVYYQLEHIKSISPFSIDFDDEDWDEDDYEEDPDYIQGSNFYALLKKMMHHWVVINGKGAENIEGVLVDFTRDHILLVHHDDVFRISTYHINSLRLGFKQNDKYDDDEDEKEDDDDKKYKSKNQQKREKKKYGYKNNGRQTGSRNTEKSKTAE